MDERAVVAQTVSFDQCGILVRVAALGAPSLSNRHIIYIRAPLGQLLGCDQRFGIRFQQNMRLFIVPPPISLADGDELFWWRVQGFRKGLVRFYITYFRLMRRWLPVLVGCYGGHLCADQWCRVAGRVAGVAAAVSGQPPARASTAAALPKWRCCWSALFAKL